MGGRAKAPDDTFPEGPASLVFGDPEGPPLVVVVGPTAVGKTELALSLAEGHRGAIVSADSRQVYAEFDLGTAKPTPEELARVPHDLVGTVSPTRTYTVAEYQQDATAAIAERRRQGYVPFLVGGTGLYVRAILDGLTIPPVAPDPERRAAYAAIEDLHAAVAAVDPEAAARLHPNDRVRLVRALEVYAATGQPISTFQKTRPCPYRVLYLGLGMPRAALYERIDRRVGLMLEAGFEAEVAAIAAHHGWDLPLLKTLGYAEIGAAVRGTVPLAQAAALMAQRTRNYAKQQLAWFRADRRIHWLVRDAETDGAELLARAEALVKAWVLEGR